MAKVFANGRSIIHAGHGQKHVAAPPDVCKTPSPGGPAPVPYPNVAADRDLAKGTKQVEIGGKAIANAGSNLKTSTGDEAGTAGGGLMSSKTKGKLTWGSSSPNVKFEGKGVVRFMDVTQQNGNSFNTVFTTMGGTGLAYADDFQGPCPICRKGPSEHRVLETPSSGALCTKIIAGLRQRFAAGQVTGKERKRWRKGFMVGVMVCKHETPQSFATMSGDTTPGFTAVAEGLVTEVIETGAVSIDDLVNANQSRLPRSRVHAAFDEARKEIIRRQKSSDPDVARGYNFIGVCAGAKLVAHAAHAPLNMSEMFFRAVDNKPWSATYPLVTNRTTPADPWLRAVLDNALSRREDHDFKTGDSVASCRTCQETLSLTMCPERICS